jgi:hypothetical protein
MCIFNLFFIFPQVKNKPYQVQREYAFIPENGAVANTTDSFCDRKTKLFIWLFLPFLKFSLIIFLPLLPLRVQPTVPCHSLWQPTSGLTDFVLGSAKAGYETGIAAL